MQSPGHENKVKKTLSDWASVAEILGAAAVVVSLLFVGFQINDGNRETRAARIQSALDSEMVFQTTILREAGIWEKIVTGVPLSAGEETRKGLILYGMSHTNNENRYLQMQSGYLENSPGLGLELVAVPFYDTWRNTPGARSRSPEWLEILDKERERVTGE